MSAPEPTADNLSAWLDYIGSVHLSEIELGLDRIRQVAKRLGLHRPAPTVITVAGTNGKGSVVASLETVLAKAAYRTGTYTSPHIHRFNERIRIGQQEVSDARIVKALAAIDSARAEVSLSYFEFATLAALLLFQQERLDVAILEVGLGGRLDAVNLVDPDFTVITSIDLDHQEWLGNDRETIALEKAGILRENVPFVCADPDPPASLLRTGQALQCTVYLLNREFGVRQDESGFNWYGQDGSGGELGATFTQRPLLLLHNIAAALQLTRLLPQQTDLQASALALQDLSLPGRQEWCHDIRSGRSVLLDVAHNPAATKQLASSVANWRQNAEPGAKLIAVVAVMADKDIQDMARNLESSTDIWYIAELAVPRGLGVEQLEKQLGASGFSCPLKRFSSVLEAYESACADSGEHDLIVITGSFLTVAAVRALTRPEQGAMPEVAA